MTELDALLAGIVSDPLEETRWLVLADWLQENDDPRRAELLRLHRKMLATCCEPDAHPARAAWQARMTDLLVAGVRPCVPQETLTLPGGVPMTFSFIPPGAFLMGSEKADDNQKPVRRLDVTDGFYFGVLTVTQTQWRAVMGTEAGHFKGPKRRPVEEVTWNDCQEFSSRLSELTGCRIELPTEVEWEYACRAGTTTEYYFGDVLTADLANYDGRYTWNGSPKGKFRKKPTVGGRFPPNSWGLFDLHGNLYELCADRYNPPSQIDSTSDHSARDERVIRGGCWESSPDGCSSAFRAGLPRTMGFYLFGFRVCLRLS